MNINLMTWFSDREMPFCPEHFITVRTPITEESKQWILEKLSGRFFLSNDFTVFFGDQIPSFEDPQEAVMYELTWS